MDSINLQEGKFYCFIKLKRHKYMKLLLYSWNANNERILADNFIQSGYEVVWFQKECRHYTRDMELAMEMIPRIHSEGIEAVVSFNYFPIISMICDTCKIPYYAWVYDCPHFTLYAKSVTQPCNHIGIFDRHMAEQLQAYGVSTVRHVPLAADTEYFGRQIAQANRKMPGKYQCDISFVGSLYVDQYNYYDAVLGSGGEHVGLRDQVDAVVRRQMFCYDEDYLGNAVAGGGIDVQYLADRMGQEGLLLGEDYFAKPEDILMTAVLEKKVTVEERRTMLLAIARRAGRQERPQMKFHLYTASDLSGLPELQRYHRGTVDYHKQMPAVFHGSRINLNISLRSIHTGIPLRVLDIMACGGFVLTNRQREIEENFQDGVEIVMFDSLEDGMDKIDYYLSYEEERREIAEAGKRKVWECFSYMQGIRNLMG